jgi:hypothetical protein
MILRSINLLVRIFPQSRQDAKSHNKLPGCLLSGFASLRELVFWRDEYRQANALTLANIILTHIY